MKRLLLLLPATTYRADAFMRAAGRLGIELTVGSDHTSVFQSAQPERLLRLSFADPLRSAEQVAGSGLAFAGVFGVDDETAVVAAHIAARLGLPHAAVPACEAARDKHRQRVLMSRAGVRVPGFTLLRFADDLAAAAHALHYPCVIKPLNLSMSRGVMRVDGAEAFPAAVERLRAIVQAWGQGDAPAFLAEEFVSGPEVAVEGVLDGGRLDVLAIFDKPDPLEGPFFEETIYATPCSLPDDVQRAIGDCVQQAAAAIGLDRGPVHAEVRWGSAGTRPAAAGPAAAGPAATLIELAARPIGGRCSNVLRFEDGRTLEELLLARALGLSPGSSRLAAGASAVMMIPTPRAGILRAVEGLDAARATRHIEGVDITIAPGQTLVPLPEGSRYLGFIFARAATPGEAVSGLRDAHAKLHPVIA